MKKIVVATLDTLPDRKPQYSDLKLPSDIQKLIDEKKLRRNSSGVFPELADEDRVGLRLMKPPAAFMAKFAAQNEQLEDRDLAKLQLEEFHAARLYTGHAALRLDLQRNSRSPPAGYSRARGRRRPMFMKFNAVLRGLPKLVPYLFKRMEELCKDNRCAPLPVDLKKSSFGTCLSNRFARYHVRRPSEDDGRILIKSKIEIEIFQNLG